MKKIYTVCLTLLAFFSIASCASVKTQENCGTKLALIGNSTAGYSWELSEDSVNNEAVSVSESDTVYLGDDGILGSPSRFDFTLTPKADGNTVLVFDYQRIFEEEDPPFGKASFDVEVQDNEIFFKSDFSGNWQLFFLVKDDVNQPASLVDLIIEPSGENKYLIGGSAGANVFNADIEVSKNRARVSDNFALTKMLGSEEEMAFEQMYISLFTGDLIMYTYDLNGRKRLVIENPSKNMTAFYAFNQEKL